MSLRVCIPTAGIGSRLGERTTFVNKTLVSIANRPILSHLIEQFPEESEFVIALGFKGNLIREFLEIAYPLRRFFFVEVEPFEGEGAGLGHSLNCCSQYLQQPFTFISCDTLVGESIPEPDENWMAFANRNNLQHYRTLRLENGQVTAICEKGEGKAPTHKPYIGLAGIYDYQNFWDVMKNGADIAINTGEAHGFRGMMEKGIKAYNFTWYDTGNPEALEIARDIYREPDEPNILEKQNEAIWFVGNDVIKFSDDKDFILNRAGRVKDLQGFIPNINSVKTHMYAYTMVEGIVFSKVASVPLFEKLLERCKLFWSAKTLSSVEAKVFSTTCMNFYRNKTFDRVSLFYKKFDREDGIESINGLPMKKLDILLNELNWEWLADGHPVRFHGDFHFENIIWTPSSQDFTFLDWRQDFGGDLKRGDIYYDFAKLLHGLIVSHEIIARNLFTVSWEFGAIAYDMHRKQILVECERYFNMWIINEGYDLKKVSILTALIFLNIAALHHDPYGLLLFALGKSMLSNQLEF
jgi:NDP-sugar pyrophosphorylase family protein